MKNCKRCNKEMNEDINYCPTCGENQKDNNEIQQGNVTFLILLCVLTIVGSVFTIGRSFLYEMVSMLGDNNNYLRGWIYAGSSVGTLIGAIMMIQRKLNGLYIYSFFQIIYLITVAIASFSYTVTFFALGVAMLFFIPSIIFLILYWTTIIRNSLS